ncbi:hypothetical protein [Methylophilus luteus]|uniref:Uncharacterized protein n=1 Tax=Methylophilus luteus TaxID=640108 RepID=A0ABW3FAP8_9PROT
MKNTEQDDDSVFIFKRKEAFVLFEGSGGGAGKLLGAIPVVAVVIIKSIFKNSEQSK